jgi:lysozyme family protein
MFFIRIGGVVADFQTALNWALQWEDPEREYATVSDAPPGAHAIAGVNSAAWPEEFAAIDALAQADRADAVSSFYATHFWTQWLASLQSDEVAKRVFDAGVNMGSRTAARLLQGAVNDCGGSLAVDGQLGPLSLTAVNSVDPAMLVAAFCARRAAHYDEIVAAKPADEEYLAGWLSRAKA